MGEGQKEPLRVDFDGSLELEFHGAKVTSDAGLLAYRELDETFGLTAAAAAVFAEWRTGSNTEHSVTALLRQSVFSRLGGVRRHQRCGAPVRGSRDALRGGAQEAV